MEESRVGTLSPRERECLLLVGCGKAGGTIASELGISEHTVNTYVRKGMTKLGAPTRHQAGYLVLEHERGEPRFDATAKLGLSQGAAPPSFEVGPSGGDDMGSSGASEGDDGFEGDAVFRTLRTVAVIAIILVAVLIVVVALKPLVDSARDLANAVQPGRPH